MQSVDNVIATDAIPTELADMLVRNDPSFQDMMRLFKMNRGKHQTARAARAKARIAHRKAKRKAR